MTHASPAPRYFRVAVDVQVAVCLRAADAQADPRPVLARQLAGSARDVLSRMSTSHHGDLRDALHSVLHAVEALEREVEMLHRRMFLSNQGILLRNRRVQLGGDGMVLPDGEGEHDGERVRVYLGLSAAGGEQLLIVDGVSRGDEVHFDGIEPALRDRLVAFVFETQRRERRRELDSASSA